MCIQAGVSAGRPLALHWSADGWLVMVLPDLRRAPGQPVESSTGRGAEQHLSLDVAHTRAALRWLAALHAIFWQWRPQPRGEEVAGLWPQVTAGIPGTASAGCLLSAHIPLYCCSRSVTRIDDPQRSEFNYE